MKQVCLGIAMSIFAVNTAIGGCNSNNEWDAYYYTSSAYSTSEFAADKEVQPGGSGAGCNKLTYEQCTGAGPAASSTKSPVPKGYYWAGNKTIGTSGDHFNCSWVYGSLYPSASSPPPAKTVGDVNYNPNRNGYCGVASSRCN